MQTILILDDNPDNLKLLELALRMHDFTIHTAMSYRDAHSLVEAHAIDLAFLDVELSDDDSYDGLDLAERLRQRRLDTVIVMISANDHGRKLDRARKIGVDAYIVKPFNLPAILKMVQKFADGGYMPDSRRMEVLR
jgi:CheY-like chemotaxis protein